MRMGPGKHLKGEFRYRSKRSLRVTLYLGCLGLELMGGLVKPEEVSFLTR